MRKLTHQECNSVEGGTSSSIAYGLFIGGAVGIFVGQTITRKMSKNGKILFTGLSILVCAGLGVLGFSVYENIKNEE